MVEDRGVATNRGGLMLGVTAKQIAAAMLFVVTINSGELTAADRLHVRINTLLHKTETGPISARCTDAEFLRRTTLNLTGTIPSALMCCC